MLAHYLGIARDIGCREDAQDAIDLLGLAGESLPCKEQAERHVDWVHTEPEATDVRT